MQVNFLVRRAPSSPMFSTNEKKMLTLITRSRLNSDCRVSWKTQKWLIPPENEIQIEILEISTTRISGLICEATMYFSIEL